MTAMNHMTTVSLGLGLRLAGAVAAQDKPAEKPPVFGKVAAVLPDDSFQDVMARMKAAKPAIQKKHSALLEERYDLSDKPAAGLKMSGGRRAVQEGVRVKLKGVTWDQLAGMSPDDIKKLEQEAQRNNRASE